MGANAAVDMTGGLETTSVSLEDIDISDQLLARHISKPNRKGEIAALYALAASRNNLSVFLTRVSSLAMELCEADSAGVSLIESSPTEAYFRWHGLAGELERYNGGTTPRDWSPCGNCLKARRATLYSYPERHFTYLAKVERPIVEGLIIPMFFGGTPVGTIWIVSHASTHGFDAEHVRIMTSIAGFATSAVQRWSNRAQGRDATDSFLPKHYESEDAASTSGRPTENKEIVWSELMERVSRGDEIAFEALFHETYALVFASVLRIVSFSADAEEITGDVYARVWTTASIFDARRGTVGGWLVTIARRGAIDRLRSRAVRRRSEEVFSLCSCQDGGAETPSEELDRQRTLNEALQSLPVAQRQVIELFYLSELSAKEIAEKVRQPIGTVKTRIRMGRLALRLKLASLAKCSARSNTLHPIRKPMASAILPNDLSSKRFQTKEIR